ncbi:hypothetical protein TorRG33x02_071100 [Trema orientale]|uniref:Uncharacterized protein n=1 Tax=Trema orientale TaxID=63057 RepID=A0A2P5FGY6_TREOI|nr:hypothetical protein TorRG33x02_071100 [Trema orientale]
MPEEIGRHVKGQAGGPTGYSPKSPGTADGQALAQCQSRWPLAVVLIDFVIGKLLIDNQYSSLSNQLNTVTRWAALNA